MAELDLPSTAAWQHLDARTGFEVATFEVTDAPDGTPPPVLVLSGTTTAVEDAQAWVVSYRIVVDAEWRTREAHVHGRSAAGERSTHLEADGQGRWRIEGAPAGHLDGCLDVDLESSALTNTLPVHRLRLDVGRRASTPAAYVRALDLRVERLEQTYQRLGDGSGGQRYGYSAPVFDFASELVYDSDLMGSTTPASPSACSSTGERSSVTRHIAHHAPRREGRRAQRHAPAWDPSAEACRCVSTTPSQCATGALGGCAGPG